MLITLWIMINGNRHTPFYHRYGGKLIIIKQRLPGYLPKHDF